MIIDHIGIAVSSNVSSTEFYSRALVPLVSPYVTTSANGRLLNLSLQKDQQITFVNIPARIRL